MKKRTYLRIASILALLLLWWVGSSLSSPEILPGPILILKTILVNFVEPGPEGKSAYFHIGITLIRILVAFGAAMFLGIGLGLAMGLRRTVEHSLRALISVLLTMPTLLMVCLAVLWFGFREAGSIVAVIAVVTPFVTVNMCEGTKAMDKSLVDMGKAFKARRSMLILKVFIPQLMPYIFAAFRYAFGMTWKIVALSETFGLKFGIGYMFTFWFESFSMDQVLAWIILFVVLMLILEHAVIARIEKRVFAWRPAHAL
jgi:NitT/TauT family transport system permease protein